MSAKKKPATKKKDAKKKPATKKRPPPHFTISGCDFRHTVSFGEAHAKVVADIAQAVRMNAQACSDNAKVLECLTDVLKAGEGIQMGALLAINADHGSDAS